MEKSSIAQYLIKKGYSNIYRYGDPHILNMAKIQNAEASMIYIIDADVPEEKLRKMFSNMDAFYQGLTDPSSRGVKGDMITLVLGSHDKNALQLCRERRNCWYLDKLDDKIYLYDSQISDFCGLRGGLEQWIEQNGVVFPSEITKDFIKTYSIPALVLSAICVLVYILFYMGVLQPRDFMLNTMDLCVGREWQRLFTSMFAHVEISHLMMNLLMLNVVAPYTEHYYGKAWLVISYLLSGLAGGILSMVYSYHSSNFYNSLGASGAIYGLIGMMLFQVMVNWRKLGRNFHRRLLLAIGLVIAGAVYSTGVDHMAHIGGFLCGYLIGAAITGVPFLFRKLVSALTLQIEDDEDDDF